MTHTIEPAPRPSGIDFANWSYNALPERTGNVGWQPDLQDLIYTAINHVEGDYEDADDNAAEQVIERLVLAIKSLLSRADSHYGLIEALEAARGFISDEFEMRHTSLADPESDYLARPAQALAKIDAALKAARGEP